MITNFILLLFMILIVYTYLVYLLFSKEPFKKMIILSLSIFFFFVMVFNMMINNMGYPVRSELPDRFHLLYVKIINDNIFILIREIDPDSSPRLHVLNHSDSLEDDLKNASNDLDEGKKTIGYIDKSISNNYYGITFKDIKTNIPAK